jgi:hypothetical protein
MGQGELVTVKNDLLALQAELGALEHEQVRQESVVEKEKEKETSLIWLQNAAAKEHAGIEAECERYQERLDATTNALSEGKDAWDVEHKSLDARIKEKQSNVNVVRIESQIKRLAEEKDEMQRKLSDFFLKVSKLPPVLQDEMLACDT